MSLREMLEKWPHDRLVKELHATAKRNAVLEDEAQRLRHQVFWLEVKLLEQEKEARALGRTVHLLSHG